MARRRAQAHAKHAYFCSCGQIVHGNGAKYQHREMHRRADDEHRWLSQQQFRDGTTWSVDRDASNLRPGGNRPA